MRFDPQVIIQYKNNKLLPEEIWKLETFYTFVSPQREEQFLKKLDDLKKKLYSLNPNQEDVRPYTIPALSNIFQICDTILAEKIKIVEEFEKHTASEVIHAEGVIEKLLDFELTAKEILPYAECYDDIGNVFETLKHVQSPNLLEKIFKLLILSFFKNQEFKKNSKYYIEASHFIRSYFSFLQENKWNYLEFLKSKAKSSKNAGYDLYKGIRDKMKSKDMPLLNVLNDIGKDKDFSDYFSQVVEEYSEKTVPVPALAKKIYNQFQKSYEEFKIDFYKVIGTLYLFKDYISLLTDPNNYTLIYHMGTYTAFSGLYLNHNSHAESEINFLNDFFVPTTPNLTFLKILIEFKDMYENAEGANKMNLLNVMLNLLYALKINLKFLRTVTLYSDKKIKQEFMELLINPSKNPESQSVSNSNNNNNANNANNNNNNKGFLFKLYHLFYSAYSANIVKQFKKHHNIYLNLDPYDEAKDIYAKVFQEILEIFDAVIENFSSDNLLNDPENSTFIKNFLAELEGILLTFDFEKNYIYKHILHNVQKSIYGISNLQGYENTLNVQRVYEKWSILLKLISSHEMIERLKLETDIHYEKLTAIFSIYNAIIVKFKTVNLESIIYDGKLLQSYVQNVKKMKEIALNIIPKRYFLLLEDCLLHLFEITIPTHEPHLKEIAEKSNLKEIIPESIALLRLEGNRLKILNTIFITYKGSFLMFRWFVNSGIFTNLIIGFLSTTEFHKLEVYTKLFNNFSNFLMEPISGDEIFIIKIDRIYSEMLKQFIGIVYKEWEDYFKVVNNLDYQICNIALKKQSIKILEFKYIGMFSVYMKMKSYMKESYFQEMIRPLTLPFLLFNNGQKLQTINCYIMKIIKNTANCATLRNTILSMLSDLNKKINLNNFENFRNFIDKNDQNMDFFKLKNYEDTLVDYLAEERLSTLSTEYLQLLHYIRLNLLLPKWHSNDPETMSMYPDFYTNTKLISQLIINLNKLIAQKIIKSKDITLLNGIQETQKYDKVLMELNKLLSSRLLLTMQNLDDKNSNGDLDTFITIIVDIFDAFEINPVINPDDIKTLLRNWLMAKTLNLIFKETYAHSLKRTQINYHIFIKNETFSKLLSWIAILFQKYRLQLNISPSNDTLLQIFSEFNILLNNLAIQDSFKNQSNYSSSISSTSILFDHVSKFYDKIPLEKVILLEQNTSCSLLEGVNKISSSILKFTLSNRKQDITDDMIDSKICIRLEEIIKKTSPMLFVFKDYLLPNNEQVKQSTPHMDTLWVENMHVILENYSALCVKFADTNTWKNSKELSIINDKTNLPRIVEEILRFHSSFSLAHAMLKSNRALKTSFKVGTILSSSWALKYLLSYFDSGIFSKNEARLRDIEFLNRLRRLLADIFNMYFCFITNAFENSLDNNQDKSLFLSNLIEIIIMTLKQHNEINKINPKDFLIERDDLDDEIKNLLLSIFTYDKTQALTFLRKDGLKLLLSRKIDQEKKEKSFRIGQIIDTYFLNSLPLSSWMELEIRRMIFNSKEQKLFWKSLESFPIMKGFFMLDRPLLENVFKKILNTQDKRSVIFSKDYDFTKVISNWNTQATQDVISYIFQNTSALTKEALNIICNTIIQNHLDNLEQFCFNKNTHSFKPMSEVVRVLNALIAKYPHLAPLIFFKDMSNANFNIKQFQSLGVYRLLNNLETSNAGKKVTFLRYYLRVVYYEAPSVACKIIRAMLCKSGIYVKLQNENVDLNVLIAISMLEEIIDILQEEFNDPQFFKTVDSVRICHFYSLLGELILRKTSNVPNIFDKIKIWHEKLISLLLKISHQMSKLDHEAYGQFKDFMTTMIEIVDRYYKNLFNLPNIHKDTAKLKRKYYVQILEMIQKGSPISSLTEKETMTTYNNYLALSSKKGKEDHDLDFEYNIYKLNGQELEARKTIIKQLANRDYSFTGEFKIIDFNMEKCDYMPGDPLYIEKRNVDIMLSEAIANYFASNNYGDTYVQPLVNPYYQKPINDMEHYPMQLHQILQKAVKTIDSLPRMSNDYTHVILQRTTNLKKKKADDIGINFHDIVGILKSSAVPKPITKVKSLDDLDEIPDEALKNRDHFQALFGDTSIAKLEEKYRVAAIKDLMKRVTRKLTHYLESREIISSANNLKNNKVDYSKDNFDFLNSLPEVERKIALVIANEEFAKTLGQNLKTERRAYTFHLRRLMKYKINPTDYENTEYNDNGDNDNPITTSYDESDILYNPGYYLDIYEEDDLDDNTTTTQDTIGRYILGISPSFSDTDQADTENSISFSDIFAKKSNSSTLRYDEYDYISNYNPSTYSEQQLNEVIISQTLLKKKDLFSKLYTFDDKLVEGILSFFFTIFPNSLIDDQIQPHEIYYFKLLARLMVNPIIELKIIDAMFYVISNPKIYATFQKIDAYSKDPDLIFPQKCILNRSSIKNTQDIYTIAVNNILHFFKFYITDITVGNKDVFFLSSNLLKHHYFKYISILKKNHPSGKKQEEKDLSIIHGLVNALELEEVKNYKYNLNLILSIIENLLDISKGIAASDNNDLNSLYLAEDKSFNTIPNVIYISKTSLDYLIDQITSENKENLNYGIVTNSSFSSKLIKNLLEPVAKDSDLILGKICKRIILAQTKDLTPKIDKVLKAIKSQAERITITKIENLIDTHLTYEDAINISKLGTILRAVSDFFSHKLRKPMKKEIYAKYIKLLPSSIDEFIEINQVIDLIIILYDLMDRIGKTCQTPDENMFNGISFEVLKGINMVIIYHFSIINLAEEIKSKDFSIDITDTEEEKKNRLTPKLSKMTTSENEVMTPQPKLMKSFSQAKNTQDYFVIFSNFLASCSSYITCYFFKTCGHNFKYEILNLIHKYPLLMGFKYKAHEYLRDQMHKCLKAYGLDEEQRREIQIRRKRLVEDSLKAFDTTNPKTLIQKLYVHFKGENEVDSGGIRREWFTLLTKEFVNPSHGLFEITPSGRTIKINPLSVLIPDYQIYFRFFGIIVAKAIQDGSLIDINFTKSFYKHILGKDLNIQDLDDIDPRLTKNLNWLLKNNPDSLHQTFSYEINVFGKKEVVELIPNGLQTLVNDKNKKDYVRKLCEAKMTEEIKSQMNAFLEGFRSIIPNNMISIFSPTELEMLLCGMKEINIAAWKKKARYIGVNENEEFAQWFWDIVTEFNQNARASLLHFISGSTKLPHIDYEGDALVLNVDGTPTDRLPRVSTCFYELHVPRYETKDKFKQKLIQAAFEGKEGFFT